MSLSIERVQNVSTDSSILVIRHLFVMLAMAPLSSVQRGQFRRVHVDRHSSPSSISIVCGCINIRSLTTRLMTCSKFGAIDRLASCSSSIRLLSVASLRVDGFNVVDRPRLRLPSNVDTLTTNHGVRRHRTVSMEQS